MKNGTFGNWPQEIHTEPEQVQRIIAAQEKKLTKGILEVNKAVPYIKVQGSADDPYEATLEECTCPDFMFRGAGPCKHIYRLAFEMGLMEWLPKYNKKTSSFDSKEELEKYKTLYLNGEMPADAYVAIGKVLTKLK